MKLFYHYKVIHNHFRAFGKSSAVYNDVRVRFAPSPTGFLHLGGLRTVIYNYLFARKMNGKFILRIEDTDQNRIVPEAVDKIQAMLTWMGINCDEGPKIGGNYGPYIQSDRLKIYQEKTKSLIENGSAYYCFCTEKRLQLLRKEAAKRYEVPRYDNHCRYLSKKDVENKLKSDEKFVIRFKLSDEIIKFEDLVHGSISMNIGNQEGDPVILKSDGYPTYHLANVVDDHLMNISHVLRGVEWQISTPKHILLQKALNYKSPQYGHLPHIVNKDGTKLSKRQGDIDLEYFKSRGYFPVSILNFLIRVGGACGSLDEKIYSIDELTKKFQLENIKTTSTRLEMERLDVINRMVIQKCLDDSNSKKILVYKVRELVKKSFGDRLGETKLQAQTLEDKNIERILLWSQNRISVLEDLVKPNLEFLWVVSDKISAPSNLNDSSIGVIEKVSKLLKNVNQNEFTRDKLTKYLKKFSSDENISYSVLMKVLRNALSNLKEGPSVTEMMEILGQASSIHRLIHYNNYFVTQNKVKDL